MGNSDEHHWEFRRAPSWLERVTINFVKSQEDDGDYDEDPESAQAKANEAAHLLSEQAVEDLVSETELAEDEVRDIWRNSSWE